MRAESWECSCLEAVLRASGSPQRRKTKQIMAADSQYSTLIGGGCPGERYMSLSWRQQEFDIYKYRGPFAFESFPHPREPIAQGGGPCGADAVPRGSEPRLGRDRPRQERCTAAAPPRAPPGRLRARPAPVRSCGALPPAAGSTARLPWDRQRSAPGTRSRGLREGGGGSRALPLILTAFSFFSPRNQAAEIAGEAPPPPRQALAFVVLSPAAAKAPLNER